MNVSIITGGSRGDVQPLLALGLGLCEAGHRVRFCAHSLFEPMISSRGLEFFSMGGNDPRVVVKHELKLNPGRSYLKSLRRIFQRGRPDAESLRPFEGACRAADLVIYHPMAGAAYHVAEKLGVASVAASLYPMTPTGAFPSPLAPPRLKLGAAYNKLTHHAVRQLFWLVDYGWVNRWRTEVLGLRPLSLARPAHLWDARRGPQLFGFSPSVVSRPADWDERLHVTGYWFLDDEEEWTPPAGLVNFINEGAPPVCICFGSMIDPRQEELLGAVLEALRLTGSRAIIVEGWGGTFPKRENLFLLKSAQYDWLFRHVSLVVHHGGSGTVAEVVRAGLASVAVPFFGEQKFWGARLAQLGVSPPPIPRHALSAERLAEAISRAANDSEMRQRAAALGERVRAENGVASAVEVINRSYSPAPDAHATHAL